MIPSVRRLDEFLWNRTANDLVDDFDALALFVRLDLDDDVTVLAFAAGLTDEFTFGLGGLQDRFAVSDLRLARGRLDLEFALHAIANDVEVEFAHAGENRLTGVRIRFDLESGIFRDQALKSGAHLFLVGLRVRLDRHGDDRLGEGWRLEANVEILVAQRIAGDDVLHADDRANVARVGDVDFFAIDRAHQHEARNALGATGARIVQRHAPLELAGVDAVRTQVGPRTDRSRA